MTTTITAGMFDSYTTVAAVQTAWIAIRAGIPQWHNDGHTRAELARICQLRVDALRRAHEAVAWPAAALPPKPHPREPP